MGPRSGSPAAETQLNKALRRFFISMGAAFLTASQGLFPAPCWGNSVETSHHVAVVVVEPVLSLTDDTGEFPLALNRGDAGTASSSRMVQYRVYGNAIPTTAVDGVISGKLSSGAEGIEIQADVGSFANQGTAGHIQLQQHAAGFQAIGATPISLADKGISSGNYGGILNGILPITWKATGNLTAGAYPVILTVTLKDS